jgi:transcriptional regulator with XRE-family HTH domain
MTDNDVVTRIARKIRATRLEKKLTIQQLANRTRVSKGLLSKIENMRTVPSLPVFVTLIQSLDVSLKDFFRDLPTNDGKGYQLIRKQHYLDQNTNGHGGINHHHILLQNISDSTMEASLVSIDGPYSGRVSTGMGYVFAFLLSGSCQFVIDSDTITLNEGDAISFDGTTDRSIRSEVTTSILQFTFASSR